MTSYARRLRHSVGGVLTVLSCACGARAGSAGSANDSVGSDATTIAICLPASSGIPLTDCTGLPRDTAGAIWVQQLNEKLLDALRAIAPDDPRWQQAFRVTVEPSTSDTANRTQRMPAVIGRYDIVRAPRPRGAQAQNARTDDQRTHSALRFSPRFGFGAGPSYRVDVDIAELARLVGLVVKPQEPLTSRFSVASPVRQRTTHVVAIHPNADHLPENLLRWYIEFSAPMQVGDALEHVHLMDEAGREVHNAFLKLGQELWDSSRTRLTLLLDPGRVKRGIRTNLEMGAPLVAGRRYKLSIDANWQDGAGAELRSGYDFSFSAAPADRTAPRPDAWVVQAPAAGTRDALRVTFGEPMDHAQAVRMVWVTNAAGIRMDGQVSLAEADSMWSFVPVAAWQTEDYRLQSATQLEDVAGNNLARVFDEDVRTATERNDASVGTIAGYARQFRPRGRPTDRH